jgi:hypothetical protein
MMALATLHTLEIALLDQHTADVQAFFAAADVASGNDALLDAGQEYGFQTWASDSSPMNGHAIMLARDLAKLMYGKEDTSPLGRLLRSYGFDFLRLEGSDDQGKTLLREHFHLGKFDGKAAFATWQHFLVVGMYGQTEQARKVKAYLLKREKASRIAEKVEESTGMSPRQMVSSRGDLLVQMAEAYRVQEQRLYEIEAAQQAQHLQLIAHQETMILAQQQALAALTSSVRADEKATMALEDAHRMTLEEFLTKNGLLTKFVPSQRPTMIKWLKKFCQDYGLSMMKVPVVGKAWTEENGYPLQALAAWLRYEQTKPRQIRLIETQR